MRRSPTSSCASVTHDGREHRRDSRRGLMVAASASTPWRLIGAQRSTSGWPAHCRPDRTPARTTNWSSRRDHGSPAQRLQATSRRGRRPLMTDAALALWQVDDRPLSALTAWIARASDSHAMPLSAATSAREILTGLHEVMAKRGSAQAKLDQVVDLIAEAMGSEVCSIYLLRDNMLELFATHGLRKEAVHVTSLRMGEGLVGTIAAEGPRPQPRRSRRAIPHSPTGRKPARSASTASPACRSSGSKARSACSPSSMPSRAATRMSRSRRCRPSRWCCRR